MKLPFIWTFATVVLSFVSTDASAQADQESAPETTAIGTPRGAAVGFIAASEKPDLEKAAEYLDLRNLPDEVAEIGGKELARQLYQIISRAFWLDDYTLSDRPDGVQGDGLPAYRDELAPIRTPDGREYQLLLQRVPRGDGQLIWKVSNRSVALIPELYEEFSYPPLIETIRKWFPEESSFLGLETFKWFILLAAGVIDDPLDPRGVRGVPHDDALEHRGAEPGAGHPDPVLDVPARGNVHASPVGEVLLEARPALLHLC